MANHYIARKVGTDLYLGKQGVHKDAPVQWTAYPRYYPTKKGLVASAKEKVNSWSYVNGQYITVKCSLSDIEILEMDGPFNIVNIENLSNL